MAQPGTFRFSIKKDDNTYYAVVDNAVIEQATPYYLDDAPKGWMDTQIGLVRDGELWGLFTKITTPYGLVSDAALIARHVMYTQGVEGQALLIVEVQNSAIGGQDWDYSDYATGKISMKDGSDGEFEFEANILQSGIGERLKAVRNIPQEIPLLDADCLRVNLDGIILGQDETFALSTGLPASGYLGPVGHQHSPTMAKVTTKGNFGTDTYNRDFSTDYSQNIAANSFFYEASVDGTVNVNIDYTVAVNYLSGIGYGATTFRASILHTDAANASVNVYTLYTAAFPYDAQDHVIKTELDITIQATERLSLIVGVFPYSTAGAGTNVEFIIPGGFLRIRYPLRNEASTRRAYRYHEVVEKAITQAIDATAVGTSNFLTNPALDRDDYYDSRPYNLTVTSGNGIRELGDGSADPDTIKISLDQLIRDAMHRWMLGVNASGDSISFLPLSEILDKGTEIANLGAISKPSVSFYTEFYANRLDVGFQKYDYDEINGRDEFNQGQVYSLGFTAIDTAKDWRSALRGDMFGIEYLRANQAGKTSNDDKADNDTFLIDVEDSPTSGAYNLYRPGGATITGIAYPDTGFNYSLSPARDLQRNAPLLAAMQHLRSADVEFKTADKNQALVSDLGAGTVTENAGIANGDLPGPLFLPYLLKFTAVVPDNLIALIEADPYGYFTASWEGVEIKGFPMEIGTKPATHDTYNITLLCHPDQDLSDLIR